MKFFVIFDEQGGTTGCERSLRKAQRYGREHCGRGRFSIQLVVITGSAGEAIRRLLGNLGGYASDMQTLQRIDPDQPAR